MRVILAVLAAWLLGCPGPGGGPGAPEPARPDAGPLLPDAQVARGAPDDGDIEARWPPQARPGPCSDLYDPEVLATFEIDIAPEQWAALEDEWADPAGRQAAGLDLNPYHPVESFRWVLPDGRVESTRDAFIRLKGNPWLSWVGRKMQLVVSFNHTDHDARFHGVRKLALDAPWYDPSMLHERLALSVLRDLGLPAQCANSARLVVNGADQGLYTNQERVDREMLERVFGDADADGDLFESGRTLETNEQTGDTAVADRFWATLDVPTLATFVDLDEAVRVWAAEAALPNPDGYWTAEHNFFLYEHPRRGLLFLPADLDDAFDGGLGGVPTPVDLPPFGRPSASVPHFDAVTSEPGWRARYVAALAEARASMDPEVLDARAVRWADQIADAVAGDPVRPFTLEAHDAAVDALRAFLSARAGFLDDWLACDAGAPDQDGDGDGASWCGDCDDGDPLVAPQAAEACNFADDDCDGRVDETDTCCTETTVGDARYALCNAPRTSSEAAAFCAAQGGTLAVPPDDDARDALVVLAYWLAFEDWWIGGDGGQCRVLEAFFGGTPDDRPCDEHHPAICALP